MSNEPLWSDQRIRDRYHALVPCEANMGEMEYWNTLRDVGERVSYELRNDYESRIAELEAQLAQRWGPLPDGFFQSSITTGLYAVSVENDFIHFHMMRMGEWHDIGIVVLPETLRLCRLVTKGADHE